jgi:starch synthase
VSLPRVLIVSSEANPWARSGGLADVLSALPPALTVLGHTVAVVIPRYMQAREAPANRVIGPLPIPLGGRHYDIGIWELKTLGPEFYFIEQPELFDRPGLYGDDRGDFPDNHIRFALLSKAALEVLRRLFPADVIHCHDWQASLLPFYLKDDRIVDPHFIGVRTLLTIHNLGYQGLFERSAMRDIDLPESLFHPDGIEFWGRINFLKAGIIFADALSTVSRKYAEEIQTPEYGFGLDGLLRKRRASLSGIVNGADYDRWNPETDALIPAHYSANDLSGKLICKRELAGQTGLPEAALGRPLLGIVSRFTSQKGFDLFRDVAREIFKEDVYLAALGNGEPEWEELFRQLRALFPGRVAVKFGFDDQLAHRIEAGSDIFLMPSRYEPCGLNQIYSLRYGTVPVVRATGGLDDTIIDETDPGAGPDLATGFKFRDYNGNALLEAIRRACRAWNDKRAWSGMMIRGMQSDFSWAASAGEYSRLYCGIASKQGTSDSNTLSEG